MTQAFKSLYELMMAQEERRNNFIATQQLHMQLDMDIYHARKKEIERYEKAIEKKCLKKLKVNCD